MNGIAPAGSGQIIGRRDEQQDALGFGTVALADGRRAALVILADGMGGHHGGAIAARLAIETFLGACRASPARTFTGALEAALLDANRALAVRSRGDARLDQMGCTLIATAVDGGVLHYVSVGDSVLWRIGEDRIERLNADHSMMPVVTAAVAQGKMTQAEAQAHGSILRSAVTGRPIELVDLRSVELARDEWVLLASDGILTLAEAEVQALSRPSRGAAQARVDALLDAVEHVGEPDQDNCTVMLLPMTGVSAKAARRPLATVLGTLAIIAGLGVVGAAGWELLRLDRPRVTAVAVRTKVLPPAPPSVATTSVPLPARLPAAPMDTASRAGTAGPATPSDATPTKKVAPTPTPSPTASATTPPGPTSAPTVTSTTAQGSSGKGSSGKGPTTKPTPTPSHVKKGAASTPEKQDKPD